MLRPQITTAPPAEGVPATRRRDDVQALRAIAVSLVVAYHFWPGAVPGGFVGVDVFFAISGFLITSLLLREVEQTGTIALGRFWARRARRILPAALLTLLVCAIATVVLVPMTSWDQFLTDIRASAAYVQNWHLADSAVDYFADETPSVAQHFWTLSIEEQFYLVWPLGLLAAIAYTRHQPARIRRNAIAAAMAVLTALSLAYSIDETLSNEAAAYFLTPARAWEFGAGGLLALAGSRALPGAKWLQWAGLAAILVAALAFTDATPFPGHAALLPVLGAIAVMAANRPLLGNGPVQWLGDVSYSVYLWHWPLLVLAPFVVGAAVGPLGAVGVLAATLLAAGASTRFVEDPARRARIPVLAVFAFAAVGTAVVIAVATVGSMEVDRRADAERRESRQLLSEHPRCFGAAARDRREPCVNPQLDEMVVPAPLEARKLGNDPCAIVERQGRVHVCAFGAPADKARTTIALVGDSHASHWRAALHVVAKREGWHGLSITRTGCPFSAATRDADEPARSNCVTWNRQVRQWLAAHPEVTIVFAAQHAGGRVAGASDAEQFAAQRDGYAKAWGGLPRSVEQVVVIRDTPKMPSASMACVEKAMGEGRAPGRSCAVSRERYLDRDPAVVAAKGMRGRVADFDFTQIFCDRARCFPVIGGALVFKDEDHFTPAFARTLAPILQRKVDRLQETG